MAKYNKTDFFSWDDDLDLDEILGEYTADEDAIDNSNGKHIAIYICPECKMEYKSISGFRGHVLKKHDTNLKGTL